MSMSTTERNAIRAERHRLIDRLERINQRIDGPGEDNFALESEKELLEIRIDELYNRLFS